MGFPVCYSELPKLLLHLLFLLAHLRELINFLLRSLGLSSLLDAEAHGSGPRDLDHEDHRLDNLQDLCSVAAELIQGSLPVVQFRDLLSDEGGGLPETCAVCLCEFEGSHEVRRMSSCRHVFHSWCVGRWLEHGQRTCPLCRAKVVADDGSAAPERVMSSGADVMDEGESPASLMHAAALSDWPSSDPFFVTPLES